MEEQQPQQVPQELQDARFKKDIARERAEEAALKAAERQASEAYGGGSAWRKVVGYVSGMTKSEKLQNLRSAGFDGGRQDLGSELRSFNTPGGRR